MTSRERMLTALRGQQPDTVPVFLRDLTLGMDITGYSTPEVCAGGPNGGYDAEKSAQSVVACWERFGHDCVVGSIQDLAMDVEALGGTSAFPERGIPRVATAPFADKEMLEGARVPQMQSDGRLPGVFASYGLVKERIGSEVAIAANVEGPVTKAGALRGMERLMLDLVDDPQFARRLVSFAAEISVSHIHALAEAGADFIFVAAAADGPAVIGPEIYRGYTIPNLRRLVEAAQAGGIPLVFHPHGPFTDQRFWPLVDAAVEVGIDGFQFGENCDLGVAKRRWGKEIAILGGVDMPTVLFPGPPEAIRQATAACIEQAAGDGGYVLMPSCSLHRGAPVDHIQVMMVAARQFGRCHG